MFPDRCTCGWADIVSSKTLILPLYMSPSEWGTCSPCILGSEPWMIGPCTTLHPVPTLGTRNYSLLAGPFEWRWRERHPTTEETSSLLQMCCLLPLKNGFTFTKKTDWKSIHRHNQRGKHNPTQFPPDTGLVADHLLDIVVELIDACREDRER